MAEKFVMGKLAPRNMSAKQRRRHIVTLLAIPGYLVKHLESIDTQAKVDFHTNLEAMSTGKVDIDLVKMNDLLTKVDKARWVSTATPEQKKAALDEWRENS